MYKPVEHLFTFLGATNVTDLKPRLFNDTDMAQRLAACSAAELDALDFGVIGFDAANLITQYNTFESKAASLAPERVMGHHLFTVVAPCMNNFMVAQRFEDAALNNEPLDATIDYVLTLRMRPVKVTLRLLSEPGVAVRYVLVNRRA